MKPIELIDVKVQRFRYLNRWEKCMHNFHNLKEVHLGTSTGDIICSNCYETLEFKYNLCHFMSDSIDHKILLKGYITSIQELRTSHIRKNRYQRIEIQLPLFNEKRSFIFDFKQYEIIFFSEDYSDDLTIDYDVGDFVVITTEGNKRSNDHIIPANSFIVGTSIEKSLLFNDKKFTGTFKKIYLNSYLKVQ